MNKSKEENKDMPNEENSAIKKNLSEDVVDQDDNDNDDELARAKKAAETLKRKEKLVDEDDSSDTVEADETETETETVVEEVVAATVQEKPAAKKPRIPGRPDSQRNKPGAPFESSEFSEKVITIKRVTKVTKGGKKLSFSALVVVGDMKGKVGYSLSKASEVAVAIKKAMAIAKKNMMEVPMRGASIPHEIIGECSGAKVLLKPASEGTGVIASGPVRAVCDGAGIHNILTKNHRSNNPINVIKATFDGLSRLKSSVTSKES